MKKSIRIIFFSFILIFVLMNSIYASTLSLSLTASKENIKKNDEFEVIVDWKEGMQAADFELEYDDKKLEFVSADIEADFYNNEDGKVKVSWFSIDDSDRTNITFKFKAISNGKSEIKTKIAGGFADGNLDSPEEYEAGSLEVEVGSNKVAIIGIGIIGLLVIMLVLKIKVQRRKEK